MPLPRFNQITVRIPSCRCFCGRTVKETLVQVRSGILDSKGKTVSEEDCPSVRYLQKNRRSTTRIITRLGQGLPEALHSLTWEWISPAPYSLKPLVVQQNR
ncbi:hypothetical protein OS493_011931 [Desmophyllum pertusum]|uniref:Uncharacterized protein n=1 Tax=Desmophyllum pertusum TaxID=174260 RepID=A0A9W9YE56_9CNID|nr:hypothetical protein OS493_011931 [Desmophyllum pertusum]